VVRLMPRRSGNLASSGEGSAQPAAGYSWPRLSPGVRLPCWNASAQSSGITSCPTASISSPESSSAGAVPQKEPLLAYKITRICLVPSITFQFGKTVLLSNYEWPRFEVSGSSFQPRTSSCTAEYRTAVLRALANGADSALVPPPPAWVLAPVHWGRRRSAAPDDKSWEKAGSCVHELSNHHLQSMVSQQGNQIRSGLSGRGSLTDGARGTNGRRRLKHLGSM
jgi:hypothetical protein